MLNVLARSDVPMSLTTISTQLQLHKSTVQRVLRVLEGHRFVSFNANGRYTLGRVSTTWATGRCSSLTYAIARYPTSGCW